MNTLKILLGTLAAAILANGTLRADDAPPAPTPSKTKAGKKYTPEELAAAFEAMGYDPKIVNGEDGAPKEIAIKAEHAGWTFNTFVWWNADKSQYQFKAVTASTVDGKVIGPAMCREMLLINGKLSSAVMYLMEYKDGGSSIWLHSELANDALTPAILRSKYSVFLDNLKLACEGVAKVEKAEAASAKAE